MAELSNFSYILSLKLVVLFSLLIFGPVSSFTLRTLKNNPNPNFDSDITLLGDAELVDNGVQLLHASISSFGLIMHTKPFRFSGPISFSTEFTFSISPHNGNSLVLALLLKNFPGKITGGGQLMLSRENWLLGVGFNLPIDGHVSDLYENLMEIDLGEFMLSNGDKLKSWVDYDGRSKRLEVRLSKFGEPRPHGPHTAYQIDLLGRPGGMDVYLGLSSSKSNSSQFCSVYSWRTRLRNFPKSMHSIPVDPRVYSDKHSETMREQKKGICPLTVLSGLIFATGCGALMAFIVLFLWVILVHRQPVFPSHCQVRPADFKYEKVCVVVEKESKMVEN